MTSTYLAYSAVFPAKSALATDEESAMKLCPLLDENEKIFVAFGVADCVYP